MTGLRGPPGREHQEFGARWATFTLSLLGVAALGGTHFTARDPLHSGLSVCSWGRRSCNGSAVEALGPLATPSHCFRSPMRGLQWQLRSPATAPTGPKKGDVQSRPPSPEALEARDATDTPFRHHEKRPGSPRLLRRLQGAKVEGCEAFVPSLGRGSRGWTSPWASC